MRKGLTFAELYAIIYIQGKGTAKGSPLKIKYLKGSNLMKDVKDFKGTKAIKDSVRDTAFSDLIEMLTEKYGSDRVTIVGNSEIAVGLDDIKLADGTISELVFTVKPVVKDYEDRKTATKTIKCYERLVEGDTYEVTKTEKEKKAEEKAKAKAEKIERDKKARAEKAKAKEEKGE